MVAQPAADEQGPLIGRERELAAIERELARATLVTILGLGGIGKTRVAQAVAGRCIARGERCFVVDLAPIGTADAVGEAVAAVLGAAESAGRDLVDAIASVLAARPSVLVLDNFEHVLAARTVVEAILDATPTARILTTSRVRLGVPGEIAVELSPLDLPSSAADVDTAAASTLFLRQARERGRLQVLEPDDAAATVEICRRLDGLPLALELAAAWSGILLPRAILRRLIDGQLDLSGGSDPRHASLDGVIDATLELVGAHERQTFPLLAVFAGPFDEGAARTVSRDDRVLGALRGLEAVGLIRVAADAHGEPKFALLETIRAVALARLREIDGVVDPVRLHVAWYADRAVAAADAVRTSSFSERRAGEDLADPNVQAAFERAVELGDGELAVRLAAALASRGMQTGILREPLARLRVAMQMPDVSAGARSDGLNALVSLRGALGDTTDLATGAREALALARVAGSPVRVVRTLITVGNWSRGDAISAYAEAAALADEIGYPWGAAVALDSLGHAHWDAGRPEEALQAAIRAEAAHERLGDMAGLGSVLVARGEYELNLGRIAPGLEHLERAVAILRDHPGLPFFMTWALTSLAAGQAVAGRSADAFRTLAEAADQTEVAESESDLADWLESAAIVLQPRHPVVAGRCLGAIDRILAETGVDRTSRQLRDGAAGRVEHAIGRRRLETERDAGRTIDPRDLFTELARLVRREAGPDRGRIRAPFGALTSREREILAQLADGRTDREIADELRISPKTASVHVANIKAKLGVGTRIEAVIFARDRLGGRDPSRTGGGERDG